LNLPADEVSPVVFNQKFYVSHKAEDLFLKFANGCFLE
jgi:hypothetical protein